MQSLCLVPHHQLTLKWRQSALHSGRGLLPFSISELVSHLLKEQAIPYRESLVLEQLAVWEVLWQLGDELSYYQPMINFSGFAQDLHRLFGNISDGSVDLAELPAQEQSELRLLYETYQSRLKQWNVLDKSEQIKVAIKYWPQSQLKSQVDHVEQYYLGDLSHLEQEFITTITTGLPVDQYQFSDEDATIDAFIAPRPSEEIDHIAKEITAQIHEGVAPQDIAVICPNLTEYLPIITPIFATHNLAWEQPALTLSETPMGKAVTILLQALRGNYSKQDLSKLVTVGWGLPFQLTQTERQALKYAPPSLRGNQSWKEELGTHDGWKEVFGFIALLKFSVKDQPMADHLQTIAAIFQQFPLNQWPARTETEWATLLQSYDGFKELLTTFNQSSSSCSFSQFQQLWNKAMQNYKLPQPVSLTQKIKVTTLDQVLGMDYTTIFMAGMTEASFPGRHHRDWITKTITPNSNVELYQQVLRSTKKLIHSYSEADQNGKVNNKSPLFPKTTLHLERKIYQQPDQQRVIFGSGHFSDPQILKHIIERYQGQQLSVSRLNSYVICPFKFLCSEIFDLKVEEQESEDITAPEEGSLLHQALRTFWEEQGNTSILDILTDCYQAAGQTLTKRIIMMMEQFVKKDLALVVDSEYQPRHLEQRFSDLTIETNIGTVNLHGIIDRIDLNMTGNYVIYDYKTGTSPQTKAVLNGEDLQLQVYLLAAQQFLKGRLDGVGYYNIRTSSRNGVWLESEHRKLGLTKRNAGILSLEEWVALPDQFYQTIQAYLNRIFAGEFPIAPINSRVCLFCAYQSICRKEN